MINSTSLNEAHYSVVYCDADTLVENTSAEDDGKEYYPFENLFEHSATLGVLKWRGENEKKITCSTVYTEGTLQPLDEYFPHDYVKMAVPFCLSLGTDFQQQPLSSWPANA
jgi:hypothetical protein